MQPFAVRFADTFELVACCERFKWIILPFSMIIVLLILFVLGFEYTFEYKFLDLLCQQLHGCTIQETHTNLPHNTIPAALWI